jgi:formylglycine-generating enzyme
VVGVVKRWRAALAASILALATVLVAGSCWNPLNWTLQTWAHLDLVKVKGGTLSLGDVEAYAYSADESPAHLVSLSPFLISRYEVTQQLYYAVMHTNPSYFQYANGFTDEPCRPVDTVSWQDAIRFCNALSVYAGFTPVYTIDDWAVTWDTSADGYRLPTEAEWEYAARGGQSSEGFYLSGSNTANDVAWNPGHPDIDWDPVWSSYITKCVGSLGSNELDLYDMSGNVCEWVWDAYYNSYYSDNPSGWTDPLGPALNVTPINQGFAYVAKGGSTNSNWDLLRSAVRYGLNDDETVYIDFGFRVVRNQ